MSNNRQTKLLTAAVALLAVGVVAGLAHIFSLIPLHVSLNPNEGWNAYHSQAAVSGGALYPQRPSLMFNNYPPLFFYFDGALGKVVGDDVIAGRLLATLGFIALAVGIAVLVRQMGGGWWEGGFAALFFAALLLATTSYVGINDPQLLGQAIDIAAVILILKPPGTDRTLVAGAALLAVAFFIKHNLIVVPLALAASLAVADRRGARRLAVLGLGFFALGLVVFQLAYGVDLISELASPRTFSFDLVASKLGAWLIWRLPVLAAVAWGLYRLRDLQYSLFCGLYLALAIVIGAIFGGGSGTANNVMFDADVALALSLGWVLTELRREQWSLAFAGAAISLAAAVAAAISISWFKPDFWLHPMADKQRASAADVAFLRSHPGPALCQNLALCYWAGKAPEVDVFNLDQAYAAHTRGEVPLLDRLRRHDFASVQFSRVRPLPLPRTARRALHSHYRPEPVVGNAVILVPRSRAPQRRRCARSAAVSARGRASWR